VGRASKVADNDGPATIRGFPPISRPDAHTLILGSMPGAESLRTGQYYAYARNSFWPIILDLLHEDDAGYVTRCRAARNAGLAIWDVLSACSRPSSLDADIDNKTIVTNDFRQFFENHPDIRRIFFNGAKSESVYCRQVLPSLPDKLARLPRQRLPSTSPAHAAMTLAEKKQAWRVLLAAPVKEAS
jgi:hypoxanthine-DNA glycosylase